MMAQSFETGQSLQEIAELDHGRFGRIGIPEAIYAPGKSAAQLVGLAAEMLEVGKGPVMATRANLDQVAALRARFAQCWVYPDPEEFPSAPMSVVVSRVATRSGLVGILTGGSTDLVVAGEAAATLWACGIASETIADIGIAGLHRLLSKMERIRSYDVLVVLAGMEGALPSVLGGLVSNPIVAVPTSNGYGASANGATAMMAMLASCAPGISVVGIDNGFGAACAAIRILNSSAAIAKAELP